MEQSKEMARMYREVFRLRGLVPCAPIPGLNPIGRSFAVLPEVGAGYCWVYNLNEYVSISIIDQTYREDCISEIVQPDYLTIGYYESVSGEVLTPYRRLASGTIHAHIGKGGTYRFLHHAGFPVRGVSVTMMPAYYVDYLQKKYGNDYVDPRPAFAAIDGAADFHAVVTALKQIKDYKGGGMAARMFYEGKVEEILSLAIERGGQGDFSASRPLSRDDLDSVLAVAAYIDEHYAEDASLAFLAKIACMSKAKLMQSFKAVYRCSIHQYRQSKRVAHAERLLKTTSLSIGEIAALVGYKNQGSFTEMYKKTTGITPAAFKRQYR